MSAIQLSYHHNMSGKYECIRFVPVHIFPESNLTEMCKLKLNLCKQSAKTLQSARITGSPVQS
jgi:hypothetical protein